jgi:hypothetical protein
MRILVLSVAMLFACSIVALGHGGKKHKKDSASTQVDSAKHAQGDTVHHHAQGMKPDQSKIDADLEDFPSLHPLIVHFAIVLIIVAAAMQLLNLFLLKKYLSWIVGVILFIGCATAWLASTKYHPHTHGISDHAKLVLEQHDRWADWTNRSALVALVLQILYLFFVSRRNSEVEIVTENSSTTIKRYQRISALVITIVLLVSAYSVSRAGHYGAQLVHIEGIGPQGKFLEMDHHH